MVDLDQLRGFMQTDEAGGVIDCGEPLEQRIENIRALCRLDVAPMGTWYRRRCNKDGVFAPDSLRWRYAYIEFGEVEMSSVIEEETPCVRFEDIQRVFCAEDPSETVRLPDLSDLYGWN